MTLPNAGFPCAHPLLAGLGPQAVAQRRLDADSLRSAATAAGLTLHDIRFAASGTDQAALLATIATALAFPAWFGANLDALYDCLTDIEGGVLIALRGLPPGRASAAILDVFRDAADDFAARQRPFVVLHDGGLAAD